MTLESAKEFVDQLSVDQGSFPPPPNLPAFPTDVFQEDVETAIQTDVTVIDRIHSPLLLLQLLPLPQRHYPWARRHLTHLDSPQVSPHLHRRHGK
jgi:hypothetical protein